ncbi:MAG TPA: STAS domain-containing protein [Vicinamibacterales bacterium]|nr:STAS domain-containing protein [Vicinamibacterales bacterium]
MSGRARTSIVTVDRTLRTPLSGALRDTIAGLLRRGDRCLVLDLQALEEIDASGIGELISAFNATRAVGGILRITHTRTRVRRMLSLTGVLHLLGDGARGANASSRYAPSASNVTCWGAFATA